MDMSEHNKAINEIFENNPPLKTNTDKVNHPSHYTDGDIEVIDYIRDKLTTKEFTGYCVGNVMKYVSRWRLKDGYQDLEKAAVYLNWAINSAKEELTLGGNK